MLEGWTPRVNERSPTREVADTVGRGYSENGAPPSAGYRNGYRRGRLASAEGPIEYGAINRKSLGKPEYLLKLAGAQP